MNTSADTRPVMRPGATALGRHVIIKQMRIKEVAISRPQGLQMEQGKRQKNQHVVLHHHTLSLPSTSSLPTIVPSPPSRNLASPLLLLLSSPALKKRLASQLTPRSLVQSSVRLEKTFWGKKELL